MVAVFFRFDEEALADQRHILGGKLSVILYPESKGRSF